MTCKDQSINSLIGSFLNMALPWAVVEGILPVFEGPVVETSTAPWQVSQNLLAPTTLPAALGLGHNGARPSAR